MNGETVVGALSREFVTANEHDVEWLRRGARREPTVLYAVVDACDEPSVPQKAEQRGDKAASLYLGWAAREFWGVAPYLFAVDEPTLEWILSDLREKPWGVFAIANASFDDIRRHLRKNLLVQEPDGREAYFRFYDPRVLQSFLASTDDSTAREFYGPIRKFAIANGEVTSLDAAFKEWGHMATR